MAGRKGRTREEIRAAQKRGERNQRTRKQTVRKSKGTALAVAIAEAQGLDLHNAQPTSTLDALQLVLDRSVALLKWAIDQTDSIPEGSQLYNNKGEPTSHEAGDGFWLAHTDAQGNIVFKPHERYELESALRKEVMELATRMEGLDIADRRTRLHEAQAVLIQRFVTAVIDQLSLTPDQRAKLGPAMRTALPLIEGTAREDPQRRDAA